MKVIKSAVEIMDNQLEVAEHCAQEAIYYKEEFPKISAVYHKISQYAIDQCAALHAEVADIIAEYRKTHGDPPKKMQMIYDRQHENYIERMRTAKNLIADFSEI